MNKLFQLIESFYGQPWAIASFALSHLNALFADAIEANDITVLDSAVKENTDVQTKARGREGSYGSVAVLPIHGAIGHRANFMTDYFGWPTTERLGQQIDNLIADPSVSTIILDIDSPGGLAVGTEELHQKILKARETKSVIAVVNGMAASAAYYIASAAKEIVLNPSGQVGSIGTVNYHVDLSQYYKNMGADFTVITAGKYKWEGHPYAPLTDEAKEEMQRTVDKYYDFFIKAVAKGRGVSTSVVKNNYGQGRMLMANEAKAAGMVDKIGSLEDVLKKSGATGRVRSEDVDPPSVENTMDIREKRIRLAKARLRQSTL